ncbi:MAG: phosphoribosylamine--glycine ligase [Cyclobacteriaceae bacterium]|nr:phosphoribosylamine--glycine ligase [Cyclobacteriaceae bacterium]UYN87366.1 MAG: phosphoribosylamine--glycine ligase [Cyclobacteriaceae bacterium]
MNILIIGNGGREHAFAWKIKQSPYCNNLYVAPGNAGTGSMAQNVAIAVDDFENLATFCLDHQIGLVVVGPEAPLVKGIRDYFEQHDKLKSIPVVGPGKIGAQLEGSKDFSKQFMLRHHIPTAKARTFTAPEINEALAYLDACKPPLVLKADGLAAGKGVIITNDKLEARQLMTEMLVEKKFGEASAKVLVEEFLSGIELSVFVLTDGTDYLILPEAKDYKRIGEADTGLNTGGMGAVSPVIFADSDFMQKVENEVVKPTISGLQKEGINYRGFIFIGLMNCQGNPFVIEYNARMGDPETQAVLPRIKNDFVPLLLAAAKGELHGKRIETDDQTAVTVVMVSGGYPGDYAKGKIIEGLNQPNDALVFHAGTKMSGEAVATDGGRVLAVTGMANELGLARQKAYQGVAKLTWDGLYFRKDIGQDLLNYPSDSSVNHPIQPFN